MLGVLAAVLLAVFIGLRYVPLIADVQAVRDTANRLSERAQGLEPADLERSTIDALNADVRELDARLDPLRSAVDDPLVRLAGLLPPVGTQVDGARSLVGAADSLTEAATIALSLAERVVAMREANDADDSYQLTTGLVELVATSTDEVDRIGELVADANTRLAQISPEAMSQIQEARDLVAEPLETYGPLLDQYREIDDVLPDLMGWGGQKRYLVLAQNPAELRPAGGYTGTVGTITLSDGRLVEQHFQNVYDLDLKKDLPFVEPPEELVELLLAPDAEGNPQSWRLADATWSPDFPTGAQKAAEFFAIEADGAQVDGVIAVTTYALDRLLEVVGPVSVPEYDVVVHPGDVTLTLLEATRGESGDLAGRKDVLDALANEVMQRLMALPPEQWAATAEALEQIGRERMAMVWLADEDAQQAIADLGWSGPVRQDEGDYVYVVESNVAPTSKYNLVVDRSDSLVVKLDEDGSSTNSLRLDWQNEADREGEPYASIRSFSENEAGGYGTYLRVLAPEGSELLTVSGMTSDPISGVERIDQEAGREVYANYLFMPPGESTVTYLWEVAEAAEPGEAGWEYRLVVQKQPGARSIPLTVRVDLPEGATVIEASDGAQIEGERVRFQTDLAGDVELRVLYELPSSEA